MEHAFGWSATSWNVTFVYENARLKNSSFLSKVSCMEPCALLPWCNWGDAFRYWSPFGRFQQEETLPGNENEPPMAERLVFYTENLTGNFCKYSCYRSCNYCKYNWDYHIFVSPVGLLYPCWLLLSWLCFFWWFDNTKLLPWRLAAVTSVWVKFTEFWVKYDQAVCAYRNPFFWNRMASDRWSF